MFKCIASVVLGFGLLLGAVSVWALQDPTRPPDFSAPAPKQAAPKPEYTLESILVSPSRRIVVINGEVLAEGERLDTLVVQRIKEDEVVVRIGKRSRTLHLSSPPVVRTP
ncbi:general secretion pathway protein GspB [Marinobacteraceae bacterium S3BR75-40.1]